MVLPPSRALLIGLSTAIWLLSSHVLAADEAPRNELQPQREGLAFDQPNILIQQRLFGLAHGVSLLATACEGEQRYREITMPAYQKWSALQMPAIEAATRDLAGYYFGARAGEATQLDVAHALKLKERLTLAPGSNELQEACATFVQALDSPRYDLVNQHRLQTMAIRFEAKTRIDAAVEACSAALSQQDEPGLDTALARWRARHAVENAKAKAVLEAEWAVLQWEGSFNQFVTQAQQRGKISATPQRCSTLIQRLTTKDVKPDDTSTHKP